MLAELSKWILSIAGIISLSVLIELILPSGQMNRYIKGILSFIIVLVIILPLPKLVNEKINLDNIFEYDQGIEVDEDYLYQLNLDKLNALKVQLENKIKNYGYKNVSVYISADIFDKTMQIKSINVDLSRLVITENAEHTDIMKIKKDISNIIMACVEINEEAILYDT